MKSKIRLGVNIDHAATLRQVRGNTTSYPDLLQISHEVAQAGADQITIHLREDRRHIQLEDVKNLCQNSKLPINLEMATTEEMRKIALRFKPARACLVPEKRQELTTEGGLDIFKSQKKITKIISDLHKNKILVSTFIEPSLKQVKASAEAGAHAVELHTGKWVRLKAKAQAVEWNKLCAAAQFAHELGMQVHAGHGLDLETTSKIIQLPFLEELNIGHSIICYSLSWGMQKTVEKFQQIIK